MIFGVLQQLRIIVREPGRLLLRELPLLEWLIASLLFIAALNMTYFELHLTALAALAAGILLALLARLREIELDTDSRELRIYYQYPLWRRQVNAISFDQIVRVSLHRADDGATQIILVTHEADMGLSVYSRDLRPWKEEVTVAINEVLRQGRRRDEDETPTSEFSEEEERMP